MKTKYQFLLLVIMLLLYYCLPMEKVNSKSIDNIRLEQRYGKMFKILKIDSVQNYYLIYAKCNDSIFKIASQKQNLTDCYPIRLGNSYVLNLSSAFTKNFSQKRDKYGVYLNDKTLIKLENDSIVWDLFLTDNLKGLCYVPSPICP